jgi:hypothetical protein
VNSGENFLSVDLYIDYAYFEKAFDTVEWSFIEKTLQFYGFGPSLQKWIKAFYCDISIAVTNNGHVSDFVSSLVHSPIYLPFKNPFCVSLIIFLSIGFILFAIQDDAMLKSTFKSVIGRQFLRKCFGKFSVSQHQGLITNFQKRENQNIFLKIGVLLHF